MVVQLLTKARWRQSYRYKKASIARWSCRRGRRLELQTSSP